MPRERAVANFLLANPHRKKSGIDTITRDDVLKFREWWARKIEKGKAMADTANKEFGTLSQMFREWCEHKGHHSLENPFAKLRFDTGIDPDKTKQSG